MAKKKGDGSTKKEIGRANQIIERLFLDMYKPGVTELPFQRTDFYAICTKHGITPLANMGDGVLYSFRYRAKFPKAIVDTQPPGMHWLILGRGIGLYAFVLVKAANIAPNSSLVAVKIPDATPEIIVANKQSDEQALLARVRYNRLIDIFMGIVAYSLQSHRRTQVKGIGQIEVDELYVGVDRKGRQFVIPVQAKGGRDKHSEIQTRQDLAYCAAKFPHLICRPISAQFMDDGRIALFELTVDGDEIKIAEERHYILVAGKDVTPADLGSYGRST